MLSESENLCVSMVSKYKFSDLGAIYFLKYSALEGRYGHDFQH